MQASRPEPAAPSDARSIVVAGQRLWVKVRRGDGTRVPLLLCNGIGAHLELLQPFVDALDPSLEVIRFDVPGVGGSPAPARPYRFPGLCRLVSRMLDAIGFDEPVDVLGISWGGGLAQTFAGLRPGRCRRLVLVATSTGSLSLPPRPGVLARMATPRRYLDQEYLKQVAPALYGGSVRAEPHQATLMHAPGGNGSSRGYLYQLMAGAGWTSLPFLPRLRQPTLIMSGDDDPLIPLANARLLRRLIPDSRLYIYRGGHLSLVTEAADLAPVVGRFLAAADPATIADHLPRRIP